MYWSESHEPNALSLIVSTLSPIIIVDNSEHKKNAQTSIDVTESGITMLCNEEQF